MRPSVSNRADSAWLLTTGLCRQTVQGVVALAHRANLTAERESSRGGECPAIGVNIDDADLDGRVVLRGDETVCELWMFSCLPWVKDLQQYSLVAAHLRGT